ncbi:MAG: PAS domain S-box protein [Cytophagaceae bacterium]
MQAVDFIRWVFFEKENEIFGAFSGLLQERNVQVSHHEVFNSLKTLIEHDNNSDLHIPAEWVYDYCTLLKISLITLVPQYVSTVKQSVDLVIDVEKLFEQKIKSIPGTPNEIIENLGQALMSYDKELRYTRWNPAMENLTGVKKENVIGRKIFEVFPAYNGTEFEGYFNKVLKGEPVYVKENYRLNADCYYESFLSPLKDKAGNIYGGVALVMNTSDRVEEQQEMNKLKDYYSSILNSLPTLVWLSGIDGRLMYVNDTWKQFTGWYPSQDNEDAWINLIHEDEKENVLQSYVQALNDRIPFSFVIRLRRHDGEYRYMLMSGQPINDEKQFFSGYVGTCFDITYRVKTETELRQKNQILDNIIYNIPAVVIQTNQEGIITEIRGAGLRKLNYKDNQHAGTSIYQLFDKYSSFIKKTLEGRQINFISDFIYQEKVVYYQNTFFLDKNKGITGLMLDITQQKNAEDQLRKKNQVLDGILSNLPVVVSRVDKDGQFTESIGMGLTRLGIKDNELNGAYLYDKSFHTMEDLHKSFNEKLNRFLEVRKGIQDRFFQSYFFADQEDEGLIGFSIDITDQKDAEDKLRKNEALLLEAQGQAHLGNWEWDFKTNEVVCSDELFRILGLVQGGAITQENFVKIFGREAVIKLKELTEKVISSNQQAYFEHKILREDGDERYIYGLAKPVTDNNGMIVKLSGYMQDISERKQVEKVLTEAFEELKNAQEELKVVNFELEKRVKERTEELSRANFELNAKNEELQKINTDLDNFVYTASHDLKAPISNLEALLMTLKEELKDRSDEISLFLDMINTCIFRLKETIQDLTDITKIQKESLEDVEMVNLEELCNDTLLSIKEIVDKNSACIEIEFSCTELSFSRKNMRSILYNLISNAIKYRSPERTPVVRIRSEIYNEDQIKISVRDNGLGIDPGNKDKIFSMFKRLHDHVDGSGVGLYIVKRIVENAQGRIEVESEPGVGSVFNIYLKR